MKDMYKRGDEYLMEKVDKAILELVIPKYKLQKAYNYYNGKRDPEQFRYLEENFGIGNPTSIEFTPLIRKHIDALVGEYLGTPLLPKVSCKDKETLAKITQDKELAINKQIQSYVAQYLNKTILEWSRGNVNTNPTDDQAFKKLMDDYNMNFISNYEIAAQNVVEYIIQSRDMDIKNKTKSLLLDLLIGGANYYECRPSKEHNNIDIEVYNPLNTFVDRDPESIYVNRGYRAVVRRWMTKQQILNKYGEEMSRDAINELEDEFEHWRDNAYIYVIGREGCPTGPIGEGLDATHEITPGLPTENWDNYNYKLIPVYEVQWIDVDREDGQFIQNRYESVRIGESIYILRGKCKDVVRSKDNPTRCYLSINGVYFVNRNNEPYSLMLATANLQDKYDLLMYFRDNVIANSGTAGDWLDLSMLPNAIGSDLTERVEKWVAYKKSGIALVDTSQEGRAFNNNTSFAGFDDTIKVQTIQAFDLALQRVEETASSITGVFRERLNGIEQKDAVSNVQAGARNSYIITKHYYLQMDTLVVNILVDALNIAKIVWKKGLTGVLIVGDKLQKIFTALPEHFTVTDYDIHIEASSQIMQEMQQVQQVAIELIKSGLVEADVAIDALTSRSMTELKMKVNKGVQKKKEETQNMAQIQQQMEQLQQQLQQSQQENQQLNNKIQSLNEAKIQIDQMVAEETAKIEWFKARTDRDFKSSQAENDSQRTEIEIAQMYDGNPYNDTVRQV